MGLSCDDDLRFPNLVGVGGMSPRIEDVEDLRNSAGDDDRLSDCRLKELEALRSCGLGDGRGVDIVRPISGRGDRITGDEGGSGVWDASCREKLLPFVYLVAKGALFGPFVAPVAVLLR
jgi:hypothetical protein